ncbi:protein phosphatase 1 regulatory subunit 3G [Astyanax mexicanus]|uniref:Protein phosphatase 1 regulatory subunit 3G n=1 Tax=Astyanax mexicanus TaxID=7994 RepID=A0A8T2LZ77_ASTMX|nr:protein phosphatase 1 regulatory subunit 3G [Astyanax mexicanus]
MSVPQMNGVDPGEEDPDHLSETELELGLVHARDRRRAKSLPAYPEQASVLLRALSHGCSKRVRFADALGLNLASVKHFSAAEEPRVPLHLCGLPLAPALAPSAALRAHEDDGQLEERVQRCGLALERLTVGCGRVHGTIRVSAHAGARATEVGVRYTLDEWQSYVDARAEPVSVPAAAAALAPDGKMCTRFSRFSFTVCAPPRPESNAAVHFALYVRGEGGELWDNNEGQNYTLRAEQLNSV